MKVTFGFYGGAVVVLLAAEKLDQLLRRRSAHRSTPTFDHPGHPAHPGHPGHPGHPAHLARYRTHSPLRSSPGHPTRSLCSRRTPHLSGGFPR